MQISYVFIITKRFESNFQNNIKASIAVIFSLLLLISILKLWLLLSLTVITKNENDLAVFIKLSNIQPLIDRYLYSLKHIVKYI